jgi:hypothetical protein
MTMDESKHTPGPWEDRGGEIVGNSRIVATACWCSGMQAEDEANRRLIAAAPDMLAALECLVNDSMFKDHPEASQMAIDAIAKATSLTSA